MQHACVFTHMSTYCMNKYVCMYMKYMYKVMYYKIWYIWCVHMLFNNPSGAILTLQFAFWDYKLLF